MTKNYGVPVPWQTWCSSHYACNFRRASFLYCYCGTASKMDRQSIYSHSQCRRETSAWRRRTSNSADYRLQTINIGRKGQQKNAVKEIWKHRAENNRGPFWLPSSEGWDIRGGSEPQMASRYWSTFACSENIIHRSTLKGVPGISLMKSTYPTTSQTPS